MFSSYSAISNSISPITTTDSLNTYFPITIGHEAPKFLQNSWEPSVPKSEVPINIGRETSINIGREAPTNIDYEAPKYIAETYKTPYKRFQYIIRYVLHLNIATDVIRRIFIDRVHETAESLGVYLLNNYPFGKAHVDLYYQNIKPIFNSDDNYGQYYCYFIDDGDILCMNKSILLGRFIDVCNQLKLFPY